jgi:hypothetical protein
MTVESDTNRHYARKAEYERAREKYQDMDDLKLCRVFIDRFGGLVVMIRETMATALAENDMEI